MFRTSSRSCERRIQTSVETRYRNRIFRTQQGKGRRRGYPCLFAENLRQLLLAPPRDKSHNGYRSGYRTGCKVVCLDAQGTLLHNEAIYPHPPKSETALAGRKLVKLVEQYKIEAIAIGNGTASRETERFVTSNDTTAKCKCLLSAKTAPPSILHRKSHEMSFLNMT